MFKNKLYNLSREMANSCKLIADKPALDRMISYMEEYESLARDLDNAKILVNDNARDLVGSIYKPLFFLIFLERRQNKIVSLKLSFDAVICSENTDS